jgi:uncharacterized protein (TIGR01244 family)
MAHLTTRTMAHPTRRSTAHLTRCALLSAVFVLVLCVPWLCAQTQNVTKENVPGVTNFARLDTTIACAGATTPQAVAGLKQMGYASIINLREASEAGADIDAEAAAAKTAGITFIHLPFNTASPNPAVVDSFLKAVTDAKNHPAFVHCASGNRAAAMWMIKRMQIDRWDAQRAGAEAAALGLTNGALKTFALQYVEAHRQ